MNRLPEDKAHDVVVRLLSGCSSRVVARQSHVSLVTAIHYRQILRVNGAEIALCDCGKSADHNGWCKARYARSPRRQAVMARVRLRRWHGMKAVVASPLSVLDRIQVANKAYKQAILNGETRRAEKLEKDMEKLWALRRREQRQVFSDVMEDATYGKSSFVEQCQTMAY